jgi:NAD-dependent SIR2 family protein deacetylase
LIKRKDSVIKIVPKISKPVKECYYSFKKNLSKDNNVVIFLGNGISEESLSVKKLFLNYIKELSEKNPRDYDKKKKALGNIFESIERKKEIDMTQLMNDFTIIEKIKNEFRSFVIQECCNARSNNLHAGILLLVKLLSSIKGKKCRVHCFTTNYDNLLERMFLDDRRFIRFIKDLMRCSLYGNNRNRYLQRSILSHYRKFALLSPVYKMQFASRESKKEFTIIPIHGSIRASKCNRCGRELQTEATAMSIKRCVYCGNIISDVIVPTAEGETDQNILECLLKEIKKSNVIIFIGYGFGDPHIMEKVKAGVESSEILVINLCRTKVREDIAKGINANIINIDENINNSLGQFMYLLKDIATNDAKEFMNIMLNSIEDDINRHNRFARNRFHRSRYFKNI